MAGHAVPLQHRGVCILSVGDDEFLLRSRELLLANAGYRVLSLDSDAAVAEGLKHRVQMSLLCHTISPARAARLRTLLRDANPEIILLRVSRFGGDQMPGLRAAPADPANLLRMIEQLLAGAEAATAHTTLATLRLLAARNRRGPFRFQAGAIRKVMYFARH